MGIQLSPYFAQVKSEIRDGRQKVFDPVRRAWLVLTPEEMVRQVVIQYLIHEKNFSPRLMSVEKGIKYNTMSKRYDLVVRDPSSRPFILVECKAPHIKLDQQTFDQTSLYNENLLVEYLWMTNGHTNFIFRMRNDLGKAELIEDIPSRPKTQ